MTKNLWLIGGGVLLVVAAVWLLSGGCSARVQVDVAPATTQTITAYIDEQAKTRLPETYLITMPIAGRIQAIPLAEGAAVKRGQVVAQIVPRDVELSVAQAKAAVQRLAASVAENADNNVEETGFQQAEQFVASTAKVVAAAVERVKSGQAMYQYQENNYGRIQRLTVTGAQSKDDLERAKLQELQSGFDLEQDRLVHAALMAVQAATDLLPTMVRQYINRKAKTGLALREEKAEADARLEQVQQDQQRATMTSPVDGVVLSRKVSNERFLAAGTTLLEIGRLEDLEVEAEILTLEVVTAKVGDRVEVYGPAVGHPAPHGQPAPNATVVRIYPAGFTKVSSLGVEQQRVDVILRFDEPTLARLLKEQHLGVGYHVRVRIYTEQKPDALTVPRAALLRDNQGGWQVYVVRDGRARLQPVEIGLMNDQTAEVTSGLKAGEPVVLAPESTLSDGTRVTAVATPSRPANTDP